MAMSSMSRLEKTRETVRLFLEMLERTQRLSHVPGWEVLRERYLESDIPWPKLSKEALAQKFRQVGQEQAEVKPKGEPTEQFITEITTTEAIASDLDGCERLEQQQEEHGLGRADVKYVDSTYVTDDTLAQAAKEGRELIGPAGQDRLPPGGGSVSPLSGDSFPSWMNAWPWAPRAIVRPWWPRLSTPGSIRSPSRRRPRTWRTWGDLPISVKHVQRITERLGRERADQRDQQVKQFNQRVKGTEKFWLRAGAEAILQGRAAYLSEDGRGLDFYAHRPRGPAEGRNRLRLTA